jgi:hydroxyethylthiazole kinase
VAVSGAVDLVTDGSAVLGVSNGVEMLTRITATGCSVTALAAAFLAVAPGEPLMATAAALAVFG